jgi:hypothetical protein
VQIKHRSEARFEKSPVPIRASFAFEPNDERIAMDSK